MLELELYITKGSNGNITFSGDVIYRFNDEAARNLPVLVNFANNISVGGIDSPSINKIKKYNH